MTKDYYVEAKLNKAKWTLISTFKQHKDALEYVREHGAVNYALRVVRVTRVVVFESK